VGGSYLGIAINHIHHGPNHPSRLVLPIIDRKDQS
jgi:hypothetical protein